MKKSFYLSLIIISILISCKSEQSQIQNIKDVILTDKSSFFYVDTATYPKNDKSLPIGVFDSGTGGLTVLDAIVNFDQFENNSLTEVSKKDGILDFQKEQFIYLGDMANMPYGQYSAHNKTDLLREHILKDVQFLLGNKYYLRQNTINYSSDKSPVKAIVIACNTATAYGKQTIEQFISKANLNIKVIGVIGAGVRGALEQISQNDDATIGVLATLGTVSSNGYLNELKITHEKLEFTGKLNVVQQAGIGWAGAIDGVKEFINADINSPREEYKGPSYEHKIASIDKSILRRYNFDWTDGKMLYEGTLENPQNIQINSIDNYTSYHLVSLMEKIISNDDTPELKSIILGCTHYPFYTNQIKITLIELYNYKEDGEYVYRHKMAESIKIIDPADNTSKELYEYLRNNDLLNNNDLMKSEFYISMVNKDNDNNIIGSDGQFTYEYKYGRNVNEIQEYVKRVPFSKVNLGTTTITMLKENIPLTFLMIKKFTNTNPKTVEFNDLEKIN
jgi:glutamate racemase